jgi:hypothetical protein
MMGRGKKRSVGSDDHRAVPFDRRGCGKGRQIRRYCQRKGTAALAARAIEIVGSSGKRLLSCISFGVMRANRLAKGIDSRRMAMGEGTQRYVNGKRPNRDQCRKLPDTVPTPAHRSHPLPVYLTYIHRSLRQIPVTFRVGPIGGIERKTNFHCALQIGVGRCGGAGWSFLY